MIEPIILNKNFERIGLVDDYSSLIWTIRYYECGDFEIVVPADTKHINMLQRGYYVTREDDDHVGIVEDFSLSVDEDQNEQMIVTGRFLSSILDRRIIATQTQLYGTVSAGIASLINDAIISPVIEARKIDNFYVNATNFTERLEAQYTGKNLLETVEDICKTNHIGFKTVLKPSEKAGVRLSDQLFDESRIKSGFVKDAMVGDPFAIISNESYPNAQYAEIDVTGISVISWSSTCPDTNYIRVRYANINNASTLLTSAEPSLNNKPLPGGTTKLYVMFLQGYTGEEQFMMNEGSYAFPYEPYKATRGMDFVFSLFKGVDRSYNQSENPRVVFSDEYDNLISSTYEEQSSELVTDVLVAGEGEGLDRKTVWASREDPTGLDRYEMYHDQRNLQSNDGEISDDEYYAQMLEEGLEQLTTITAAFDGTVYFDSIKYREDVSIGDVVVIENTRWNIAINSRLIEVIESVDESGAYEIVPTFGV